MTINHKQNELLHLDDPLEYIVTHLEQPISVEASAGCGKTFTLIARVSELLKSGRTSIDRLLLLTFTENAAAEMKNRLVAILREHETETWAYNALENLHLASIQTIHSFAYEICTQFHDSLGLPDDISIVDSLEEKQALQNFFNAHYDAWGNDPQLLVFFRLCKILGIKRSSIQSSLQQILGKITYLPGDTYEETDTSIDAILADLRIHTRRVNQAAESLIETRQSINFSDVPETKISRVDAFLDLALAISQAHDDISVVGIARDTKKYIKGKKFDLKIAKTFLPDYVELEEAIAQLGTEIQKLTGAMVDATLRFIVNQLFDLAVQYRNITFSSGQITFDDSIIAARRAIEIDSIREQLWAKYDSIIVDEFQDTDIHQLAILDSLADEGSSGELARIFVVGDDKQSIYGFRGATVEGYKDFVRTRPITRVALSLSRRTVPSVINTINTISEKLIDEYLPLHGTRTDIDNSRDYHVKFLGGEMESNIDSVREAQAHDVVSTLSDMYQTSLVFDKEQNIIRPCTYTDMTILIRDKNSLGSITSALEERAIPYSIDSSALVWELTMVRTLLAVLVASSQPRNGYGVIGALKSPIFHHTNDELTEYALWIKKRNEESENRIKNIWDYRNIRIDLALAPNESVEKVLVSLHTLNDLHRSLPFFTPSQYIHHLLFENLFFQPFMSALGESHSISVTQFLLSNVISWEDSHRLANVADYIDYLERNRKNSAKSDSFIHNTGLDRVRVMTVHSSKGLEFPIVALIASHGSPKDRSVQVIATDTTSSPDSLALSVSSKIYDSRLDEHKDALKDHFLEEESRLTYVGLTRAQDHLIVATHHKKAKTPTNQAALIYAATADISRYTPSGIQRAQTVHTNSHDIDDLAKTHPEYERRQKSRRHLETSLSQSRSVNATSMKPEEFIDLKDDDRKLAFLSHSAAPAIGKAVHRALNVIDFDADTTTIDGICRRCCANEGIDKETDIEKCIAMVSRALSLPILHTPRAEILREVPISGYIEGVFCEGYIDCLIKTDDAFMILDYKTDTIDEKRPLEKKVRVHSIQLAFYSLLLKQTTGVNTCGAALLFLNHEDMPYIEIQDLDLQEKLVTEQLSHHTHNTMPVS